MNTKKRASRANLEEDEILLPLIRGIVDERASYGYRRVAALLNRQLIKDGKSKVNHKRVYRIMKKHAFTSTGFW